MSLAFLFPGQGSQQPNMLHALPNGPAVAAVISESRSCLARLGLPEDIDSAAALQDTTNVQIALLIAGVACARALTEEHGLAPRFVAGHSVGAFAAAVTAGAMSLDDALTTVELRGRLMNDACRDGDWGMAAITGLPIRSAQLLAERTGTDADPLWLANVNSATQTVLSGTATALHDASHAARTAGATDFERLDVAAASHCPVQADTAIRLAQHLAGLPRHTPAARYLTNSRGRAVTTADAILDDLAQSVAQPVQWYDATRLLPELGATCAIETQPGHVLAHLCTANAPGLAAFSLQDTGLAATVARARQLDRPNH
ncbi:ACP S-malonyltransferase [Mycobacterium sp. URHB0044]|jgi:malonate decarboxylase epsilon subunit|uniref:ACP S-malonyltransferase n=1 Tax=Mycobacterium sp. URHB0044 TaxID=1380386 RepID=UPI00055C0467|nr:acyltransferase domain-containing protein [Mycobacterium sp. URHB0044]